MTRKALLALNAAPARTGLADWRRFRMLSSYFASIGFEITALYAHPGHPGAEAMRWLMQAADHVALCPANNLKEAASALDLRRNFDLAAALAPELTPALDGAHRAFRLVDLQNPIDDHEQEHLAQRIAAADIALTAEPPLTRFVETQGQTAVEAPTLISGARKIRPRVRTSQLLAGAWVERDAASVAAVNAFFTEVVARGGGGAPNFAIAGPGADQVTPPPLPFPVTRMDAGMEETVFYRGLDLAVAPDIEGKAPRLDVVSALECGAAPLASSSALNGLRRRWRLPHFRDLGALADFLFERGRELREGGLLTELRARADWTWSGLVTASARQRARLNAQIRANLPG